MAIRLGEKEETVIYSVKKWNSTGGIAPGYEQDTSYISGNITAQYGYVKLVNPSSQKWDYDTITSTGLSGKYVAKGYDSSSTVYDVYYVDNNSFEKEKIVGLSTTEYRITVQAQKVYENAENLPENILSGQARTTILVDTLPDYVTGAIIGFGTSVSSTGSIQNITYSIVSINTIDNMIASLVGRYFEYKNVVYQISSNQYSAAPSTDSTYKITVIARPFAYLSPSEKQADIYTYYSSSDSYRLRLYYYEKVECDYVPRPYVYGLGYTGDASKPGGVRLTDVVETELTSNEIYRYFRQDFYVEIDGYIYFLPRYQRMSYSRQSDGRYFLLSDNAIRIIGMQVTQQPTDQETGIGGTATFTVEVNKTEGVHYQWQESADGINWTDINSATGSTYSVIGSTDNNGHQFRCYITADDGSEALSDAATLLVNTELRIVEQPQDKEVWVGVSASFVCKASGDTVTYQWQRSDDGTTWTNISGATSTTYTLTAAKTDDGAMFRCVVTDRESNSLTSNSATLTANLVLGITQQPTDASGKLNTTATFHVGAVGEGLTYQWYYSKNFTSFLVAQFDGATTDTMTLPIYGKYNNYKFYCIITDFEANSVTTNTVTLTVEYEHSESEAGAGETYLGQSVKTFTTADEFDGYSKVVINIDDETYVSAGNDDGRTLELECPWGTQQMANNILSSVRGFQYQPYEATGALLDPSAELGDGVTISGTYSGIYKRTVNFGALSASEISAPTDEEVDHEYPYETYTDRKVVRKFLETRADLRVTNALIEAKVSKTGGNNESFGWSLTESAFVLSSNDKEVFRADSSGIKVDGEIRARTGYIGSDSSGFAIDSKSIHNGVQSFSDTAHSGVYIGTDGIVLGKGAFKVDTSGNLTANSGTFKGNVYAGNIQSTAVSGVGGSFNGAGITSSTVGNTQLTADVKSQLLQITENTNNIYALLHGSLTATALYCNQLSANYLFVGGIAYARMGFMDYLGNVRYCLGAV